MSHGPDRTAEKHPVLLLGVEPGDRAYDAGARCCLIQADGSPMLFRTREAALRFCEVHRLQRVSYSRMRELRVASRN